MFKTIFRILYWSVFLSIFVKCDSYEFPIAPYPKVVTLQVVGIPGKGVTFQGDITHLNDEPIVNHGFVWGLSKYPTIKYGGKIELGSTSTAGVFHADLEAELNPDSTYNVRAFISTKTYLFYGENVSFKK